MIQPNKRRLKMLLLAPVIVVPLLILLAMLAGVGKTPSPKVTDAGQKVPAPEPPPVHPWSKMSLYDEAERDSTRFTEAVVTDKRSLTPVPDTAEARMYKSLDRLQTVLQRPLTRPVMPAPVADVVPVLRKQPVVAPDTDLERLDRMLDKILLLQNPRREPFRDTAETRPPEVAAAARAVTEGKSVLVTGETISLRLETDLTGKGWTVPAGTNIYGTVSLENERLRVYIHSIYTGTRILSVHLEGYDLDGQPGIFVPGSLDRDAAKASADQAINTLGITELDPSLGAQAAGAGIQAVKTLLSRKVRLVRVTVREGYRLLIK